MAMTIARALCPKSRKDSFSVDKTEEGGVYNLLTGFQMQRSHSRAKEVNPVAYHITDACVNCGACDDSCPIGAIYEKGDVRVIDADACADCGACLDSCPVDAIKMP
jgi:ferredoxin